MLTQKKTTWMLGAPLVVAVAVLALAGCSSPSTSTGSGGTAVSAPSATTGDDAGDTDDDADEADAMADAGGTSDAGTSTGSHFDTATAIVDAFVAAGGVCTNPADSKLSLATSSIDCLGASNNMQTIAVFATPDEARSWYNAQKAVKVTETTTYLLGENWAMFTDGTGVNAAHKLGTRDISIEMR